LDLRKGALVGEPVTVADGVFNVSVSATGLIAYRQGGGGLRQLTWVDRSGAVLGTLGGPDASLVAPRVSPDGTQVAFSRETQGKMDLWLQDGARSSRVTFGSGNNIFPAWSPDGNQLAFLSATGPTQGFYLKLTNGAQAQEQLLLSSKIQFLSSWSPDGKYLLYFGFDPDTGADLRLLPITGDRKPISFLKTPATEVWGQFSPDGKWVAYQSTASGVNEVYVRRFFVPGGASDDAAAHAGQWQVSAGGGVFPTWRADGKELFYLNPAGTMMAASITDTGSTVVPGTPVALFQAQVYGGGSDGAQGRQYDVAPDGRFMINRNPDAAPGPITLIQNWNPHPP
jgi:Tol biopolymer transport system component